MHFGQKYHRSEVVYILPGASYQETLEAAMSPMVGSAGGSEAAATFPFVINNHPVERYSETIPLSERVILAHTHVQGPQGWSSS